MTRKPPSFVPVALVLVLALAVGCVGPFAKSPVDGWFATVETTDASVLAAAKIGRSLFDSGVIHLEELEAIRRHGHIALEANRAAKRAIILYLEKAVDASSPESQISLAVDELRIITELVEAFRRRPVPPSPPSSATSTPPKEG